MKEVLIDSSLLVEYFKGNQKAVELLESFENQEFALYITETVFSEVVYLLLSHYSKVAPRTIKGDVRRLPPELDLVFKALESFGFVGSSRGILSKAEELIKTYALLPNDALILATCIEHGFSLATLDEDFLLPAKDTGIEVKQ
ncbi:type II toxin-antitoxin system VapC family toxin [Palaeococcus sp. (in: euryarchaeotes)]|uniref:type II toxin-antitoxin system VapC family toxin n=1 Tax=Palaeococcus sp. (in: euryarchaeotes) TaxID=2820298 RepID=UPI000F14D00F|nr:type II toxin-antitoxin system VapC family toxin [Palaeococcus sp. (in: euryarchaeotes)]MCD6558889.1 PIN domain-containing protein [Palaeococcus sp. (in: euryarchaeotes)]RLF77643.1 MAG: VapC toxin family PIN domain ribonuclease [Thermococci archaeon]